MAKALAFAVVVLLSAPAAASAQSSPSKATEQKPCDACTTFGALLRFDAGVHTFGGAAPAIGGTGFSTTLPAQSVGGRLFGFLDRRASTGLGALHVVVRGGLVFNTGPNGIGGYFDRAFIELGGVTAGKAQSFFDFRSGAYGFGQPFAGGGSFTGDTGILLAGYEQRMGALSVGASVEHAAVRRNGLWDLGTDPLRINDLPGPLSPTCPAAGGWINLGGSPLLLGTATRCRPVDYAASSMPDVVARVRVSHAWGTAQGAFAVHRVAAGFFGADVESGATNVGSGHFTGIAPASRVGWAAMGGVDLVSRSASPDHIWAEFTYSVGAPSYTGLALNGTLAQFWKFSAPLNPLGPSPTLGAGWALDGVFANAVGPANAGFNGTAIELTRAWALGAAYEHRVTSSIRVAAFGTFNTVDFNAAATALFCESPAGPVRTLAGAAPNFATGQVIGCNPDFTIMSVGGHAVWAVRRDLSIGPEVMFTWLGVTMPAASTTLKGFPVAGIFAPGNQMNLSALVRIVYRPSRQK